MARLVVSQDGVVVIAYEAIGDGNGLGRRAAGELASSEMSAI